jgi:hypothetical protein
MELKQRVVCQSKTCISISIFQCKFMTLKTIKTIKTKYVSTKSAQASCVLTIPERGITLRSRIVQLMPEIFDGVCNTL